MRGLIRALVGSLALLAPMAPAQNLPDLGESAQAALSAAEEREIGAEIMREIRGDSEYVDDPEVSVYVQALGRRLAGAPSVSRRQFEFFVIRNPQVNAFALPGGYIGIHSGLIMTAQTESEVASVVAHEIAHVEQRHMARMVDKQNQLQVASIAALALAILAAGSSPELAQAAMVSSQAAPIQFALAYSRDFEREADRVGFQILEGSGYDVHGMPAFFERMQRATRLYENNAPGYLRTHPLTSDRIADMQNRALETRFRQIRDTVEFGLVRAKLRAETGAADSAVAYFRDVLAERRFADEAAAHYGYAVALVREKRPDAAAVEVEAARRAGLQHPMLATLAARVRLASGDRAGAVEILAAARIRYPGNAGVAYEFADALMSVGRARESLDLLVELVKQHPSDPRLYEMQARAYSGLGKRAAQHRALAEMYLLKGGLSAAIEQLQLAQKAGDGDFFVLSAVDARLRELRKRYASEVKRRR